MKKFFNLFAALLVELFPGSCFPLEPIIRRFDNVLLVKQDLHNPNFTMGSSQFLGLTRQQMLAHADFIEEITKTKMEIFGEKWSFADVCHRMKLPDLKGEFSDLIVDLAHQVTPCTIVSPLDCFWEGSRIVGPVPDVDVSDIAPFLQTLPKNGRVSWKNLNPAAIMREVEAFGIFKIDPSVHDLFIHQFGSGFQKRACLNPFSPECPSTAPNSLYKCKKQDSIKSYFNQSGCSISRKQLDQMHRHNLIRYYQLMDQHDHMDIPAEMKHGCPSGPMPRMRRLEGVGLPGAQRDHNRRLVDAEGLETAMILTDPAELYNKVQRGESKILKNKLRDDGYFGGWSPEMAKEVLNMWKWNMIDYMPRYNGETFHAVTTDDYYLMERPVFL